MSYGGKCLVVDKFINYQSNATYNFAPKTYTHLRSLNEKNEGPVCCYYDGYEITKNIVGLPKKRKSSGEFVVWGYFCSYECARSYIVETRTSCHVDKETSLLALMAIQTHGIHFRLNRAPDKALLKKFGGPLSIEQWRSENLSNRLWVVKTPETERTFNTYECFLNHNSVTIHRNINNNPSPKSESAEDVAKELQISKRKTPAHFTKKSLLSLVSKKN